MMRTRLLTAVLAGGLSIGCDPDPESPMGGGTDTAGTSDEAGTGEPSESSSGRSDGADGESSGDDTAGGGCLDAEPIPERVDRDLTVGPGCVVMGQTSIRDGAHLEFVENTTVMVLPDGFLDAGGGFGHEGRVTATKTTFTSAAAEPAPGDWGCIALGTGSALTSVIIEFAGADCGVNGAHLTTGLYIDGPTTKVTATIVDSAGHGLTMDRDAELLGDETATLVFSGNALPSVSTSPSAIMELGTSVFEDPDDYIAVGSPLTGRIDRVGVLHAQPVPYVIDGNLDIGGGTVADASVTIEAGVEIRMSQGSIEVGVDATLIAQGTSGNPVVFTSDAEDPAPGDWGCMHARYAKMLSLQYAVFEYAGSGEECTGASVAATLARVPADSIIVDSVFRESAGAGIEGQFGVCDPEWCSNTFEANAAVDILCPGSDPDTVAC